MARVSTLISLVLRAYPLHYPDPIDALIDILGTHSAFEWRDGEIHCLYEGLDVVGRDMQYNDLDEQVLRIGTLSMSAEDVHSAQLNKQRLLGFDFERQRRKFVDANMEAICQGDPTLNYTRCDKSLSAGQRDLLYGNKQVPLHARFLRFPSDITPDWAHAVSSFHQWIIERLTQDYKLIDKSVEGGRSHWPDPAKRLHDTVKLTRDKVGKHLSEVSSPLIPY